MCIILDKPKISVITVCYNAVDNIDKTILSVINQTYNNIEYIVIDGASTDGTVDIIKKYSGHLAYWISEPDMGIYDAMNKGIRVATGDYINFMNAGDSFFSDRVVADVVQQIEGDSAIIYGDTMYVYAMGKKLLKPLPVEKIKEKMFFNHQSSFADAKCLKESMFDSSYRISADYKFHYDLYNKGLKFQYIPDIIAYYDAQNGVSSIQIPLLLKEYGRVQGKSDSLKWKISYFYSVFLFEVKKVLKIFVPKKVLMKRNGIR